MQLIAFVLMGGLAVIGGGAKKTSPADPAHQLDFWVGSWKCEGVSYGPNGKSTTTVGTNNITREMNGHVIHEHFHMEGLNGASLSVYNPQQKIWQQTWVDDSGGYIALNGALENGNMTLSTETDPSGRTKRMVFSNVSHDSFDWDWQGSKDQKTWRTLWHLHYVRVKK